ncbi:hypothetical protein [Neptunomonas japonica]|uniref:Exonuclease domain-containing protein n=1 Tax=Neptunomonas japonica JAMM 1380 TaxID=1441457 RepID=A0A7R6PPC6_9GAMM|nr:hypothetical protein [Neptunomonas japonica]BBB30162.1 conserved hypothetical protein [Neptunomonas japonica JAMM 1380]
MAIKVPVICIDIEASGLGPLSYPIEVAWKCGLTGASDLFLINPDTGYNWTQWDLSAADIHGITMDELLHKGISVNEACERLNQMLDGKMVTSDALDFDFFWMRRLFESAMMKPTFKMQGIDSVLEGGQLIQYRLIASAQVRKHRAMDDVNDLFTCLAACQKSS